MSASINRGIAYSRISVKYIMRIEALSSGELELTSRDHNRTIMTLAYLYSFFTNL